jgi:large subunit ribosomal protein L18
MINDVKKRNIRRCRRSMRVRKQVRGTGERPRLSVFKSNAHICAQLIDDDRGCTLASAGTITKEFRNRNLNKKCKEAARLIGIKIAEAAKQMNITGAVFDRGYNKYHGVLAEIANGARETGLQF